MVQVMISCPPFGVAGLFLSGFRGVPKPLFGPSTPLSALLCVLLVPGHTVHIPGTYPTRSNDRIALWRPTVADLSPSAHISVYARRRRESVPQCGFTARTPRFGHRADPSMSCGGRTVQIRCVGDAGRAPWGRNHPDCYGMGLRGCCTVRDTECEVRLFSLHNACY